MPVQLIARRDAERGIVETSDATRSGADIKEVTPTERNWKCLETGVNRSKAVWKRLE